MTDQTPAGRIDAFEATYLPKVRAWATFVDAKELEHVIEEMHLMDQEVQDIGRGLDRGHALYQSRWRPLLEQINGMLPTVAHHLGSIRDKARMEMGRLEQGQRGLVGYRQSFESARAILDEDA